MTLTAENVRQIFDYDPATGELTKKAYPGMRLRRGSTATSIRLDGYLSVSVMRKHHYAHRVVWLWMTGMWPENFIDHIDGKKDNNRWANLRSATKVQNGQNQREAHSNSQTGLLGAHPYKDRFRCTTSIHGRKKHIGYFMTAEEAHRAYIEFKRIHHEANTL